MTPGSSPSALSESFDPPAPSEDPTSILSEIDETLERLFQNVQNPQVVVKTAVRCPVLDLPSADPWGLDAQSGEPSRLDAPSAERSRPERSNTPQSARPKLLLPPEPAAVANWGISIPFGTSLIAAAAIGLVAIGAAFLVRTRPANRTQALEVRPAKLTVDSRPAGAELIVDGETRGSTPVTISLSPGGHLVTLRSNNVERSIPVQMASGIDIQQYFDFASANAPTAAFGKISVVSDPPKLRVSIDGRRLGITPLLIDEVAAGPHRVNLTGTSESLARDIVVEGGATASLVFTAPKASSTEMAGWLKVSAPFECLIFENGEMLGTTHAPKTMLTAGVHELTLTNQVVGFQESQRIEVTPGKVTAIVVNPPKAELSANARPWADVSIDGEPVGQTPLGHVVLPIGSHEIVFQHPQLGERRQTIVVTSQGPNRAAVDLSK
jgi:hypothetical protein